MLIHERHCVRAFARAPMAIQKSSLLQFPFFADLVVIARSLYPIPSRTRPSKSSAPMVLNLKVWKSRSLPGLPRTERFTSPHHDIQIKGPAGNRGAFLFGPTKLGFTDGKRTAAATRKNDSTLNRRSAHHRLLAPIRPYAFAAQFPDGQPNSPRPNRRAFRNTNGRHLDGHREATWGYRRRFMNADDGPIIPQTAASYRFSGR
jgi:hypothetical protein